jgi:hypothetical protein
METAMNFWDYVLIGLGFWIAFRLGQASILAILKDEMRERIMRGDSVSSAVRDIVDVDAEPEECVFGVERHQGHWYAFAESGEFLAQGPDFKTMFAAIKSRFPGRSFRINPTKLDLTEQEARTLVQAIVNTFGDKNVTKN